MNVSVEKTRYSKGRQLINYNEEGIELREILPSSPYNDIWYRDCYYMALFQVMKILECDVSTIILNDVPLLKLNDFKSELEIEYYSLMQHEESLLQQGIKLSRYPLDDYAPLLIQETIQMKNGILVSTDHYYNPLKHISYKNKHQHHLITINGYDTAHGLYFIIDDSLGGGYKQLELSFSDMHRSMQSAAELGYGNGRVLWQYERVNIPQTNIHDIIKNYSEFILENIKALHGNVDEIESMRLHVDSVSVYDIVELSGPLNGSLWHVKCCFEVELYRLKRFFADNVQLIAFMEEVARNFSIIWSMLYKISYTKQARLSDKNNILKRLDDISQNLMDYYSAIERGGFDV